eukprot:COSAG04_NODE_133_length_23964_cov_7.547999_20_plen_188_part_00
MRPALGASLLLLARSSGGGSLPNPPGPTLRQLAAARTPPLLIGSDLVDVCPFPCTGAPARTCQAGAMAPNASYASIAADQFNFGNWDCELPANTPPPLPAAPTQAPQPTPSWRGAGAHQLTRTLTAAHRDDQLDRDAADARGHLRLHPLRADPASRPPHAPHLPPAPQPALPGRQLLTAALALGRTA